MTIIRRKADLVHSVFPSLRNLLTCAALMAWACSAIAATCSVVHAPPPNDAEKALRSGHYEKAEALFQGMVAQRPGDVDAIEGLIRALLSAQKVREADEAVKGALAKFPQSPKLVGLRGEVEYREGLPWKAAQSADEAVRLDPCNAHNLLLMAKIARLNSLYATSARLAASAHRVAPDDPEVWREWIKYLPLKQRIVELGMDLERPAGSGGDNPLGMHPLVNHLREIDR